MLSRTLRRAAAPCRRLQQVRNMGSYVNPKDASKVWLSDFGTYPVFVVCAIGGGLVTWWNARLLTSQPRISWKKETRANLMKETHQAGEKYYNHALRNLGKAKHASLFNREW